jgi:hypothetical protein
MAGKRAVYRMAEVAKHAAEEDCWTVIKGKGKETNKETEQTL